MSEPHKPLSRIISTVYKLVKKVSVKFYNCYLPLCLSHSLIHCILYINLGYMYVLYQDKLMTNLIDI